MARRISAGRVRGFAARRRASASIGWTSNEEAILSQLTVRSADGTTIAADLHGGGEPLVLVHGMAGSSFTWARLVPELENRFTIIAVQRRGRGDSGDTLPYSLEREAEDIIAVLSEIGRPALLFGHSFGANVALEAAMLQPSMVSHLYLYEASVKASYPDGVIERVEALAEAGRAEEALEVFLRECAHLSEEEVATLRAAPSWSHRVGLAHTIAREMRVEGTYTLDPDRVASLITPTLLLLGEVSDPDYGRSAAEIGEALPVSATHVLAGQGHAGIMTAPELVAELIAAFAA